MTSLLFALAFVASLPAERSAAVSDPLSVGRSSLQALDYEGAVSALTVVAADESLDATTRARAHMLIAEARFGIATADGASTVERALRAALALDARIDFERREDVSPRLVALFEALPKPEPTRAEPTRVPETTAPAREAIEDGTRSPWWIASAALGATTLIAGGVAGAIELSLGDPAPLQSADAIRGTQRAGAAAVVIAAASAVGALGATAFALSSE